MLKSSTALLLFAFAFALQADQADQAAQKARTATASSSRDLESSAEGVRGFVRVKPPRLHSRGEEEGRAFSGRDSGRIPSLGLEPASCGKECLLRVPPGSRRGFSVVNDSSIVSGDAGSPGEPPCYVDAIEVSADNCVVRNVECGVLLVRGDVRFALVDSAVKFLVYDFHPSAGWADPKKAKCQLVVSNCVVVNCVLDCPRDYMVNAGDHEDTVYINNNGCQFKFRNCSFRGGIPFRTAGDVNAEFIRCVFSSDEKFCEIDREMGGKCSLEIEDCAFYCPSLQGSSRDKRAFGLKLRKDAGQANLKGRLLFLDEPAFAFDRFGSKEFSTPPYPIRYMAGLSDSPAVTQLAAGAAVDFQTGRLATKKSVVECAVAPAAVGEIKLGGEPKPPKAKPSKDDELEKEMEDAAKKLSR